MKRRASGLCQATGLLVSFGWLCGAALAADASAPAGKADQELDEVLVTGARVVRKPEKIIAWLNRLVGRFSYEGHVELRGDGASPRREAASGEGKCVPYGPSVHCTVQVVWPEMRGSNGEALPGGVSTLAPAMVMYGMDLNYLNVLSMQVDNRGMADSGVGDLRGDTLTTTTPCADLPGNCKRVSRIEARPDGKLIRMQIDIEQDARRVARYAFVLRRVEPGK